VAGVAVLGSVVNGQLTVNLVHRLAALGIPKQFQSIVIAAVETGTVHSQANAYHGGGSLQVIVNQVVTAAYGAFGSGLDLALSLSGSLLLVAGLVAAVGLRGTAPGNRSASGSEDLLPASAGDAA